MSTPRRLILLLAALALVAGLLVWQLWPVSEETAGPTTASAAAEPSTTAPSATSAQSPTPSATSTATPSPKPSPGTVSAAPSSAALPAGCDVGPAIVPARFEIPSHGVDSPVLALDADDYDGTMAPPPEQAWTVAWWEDGPKPGSGQGKVSLTAHTYRNGGALGNLLQADDPLEPGDLIRISDAAGETRCYQFTEKLKFAEADYDPNSEVIYSHSGDPMLALVVCWDFNWSSENWDSRIVFYAEPIS